jgi:hypothetical protein
MTKPTLREKIDTQLDIFDKLLFKLNPDDEEYENLREAHTDQIIQAVQTYCEELIGEDEGHFPRCDRNDLRQQQRQKLKEELG